MTNMYQSSKGPVAIDTMALPYAKNALAKLQRDDSQRHRTAEIGWLDQHIRKLEAEAPTEEPNRGIGGDNQVGRESGEERVCPYVEISGGAVTLTTKNHIIQHIQLHKNKES